MSHMVWSVGAQPFEVREEGLGWDVECLSESVRVLLAGSDAPLVTAEQAGLDAGSDRQFDLGKACLSPGRPQPALAFARNSRQVLPLMLFLLLPHALVKVIMCRNHECSAFSQQGREGVRGKP